MLSLPNGPPAAARPAGRAVLGGAAFDPKPGTGRAVVVDVVSCPGAVVAVVEVGVGVAVVDVVALVDVVSGTGTGTGTAPVTAPAAGAGDLGGAVRLRVVADLSVFGVLLVATGLLPGVLGRLVGLALPGPRRRTLDPGGLPTGRAAGAIAGLVAVAGLQRLPAARTRPPSPGCPSAGTGRTDRGS